MKFKPTEFILSLLIFSMMMAFTLCMVAKANHRAALDEVRLHSNGGYFENDIIVSKYGFSSYAYASQELTFKQEIKALFDPGIIIVLKQVNWNGSLTVVYIQNGKLYGLENITEEQYESIFNY